MITWITRTVNVFSNTGMYFIIPYAGSAIATIPSIEIAGFSAMVGLILSASREGLDYVREESLRKKK